MAEHTLYGKRKLCYTEVTDFTDFQGIGRDPLYKRFDSVLSVIEKHIDSQYRDFLAHPIYSEDEDQILWHVREWNTTPCTFNDLGDVEKTKYSKIKEQTISIYQKVCNALSGEDKQILVGALKHIDEDFMFCYDDKVVVVAWGMMPDTHKHVLKGAVVHDLQIKNSHKIKFVVGDKGVLTDKLAEIVSRADGAILSSIDLPVVTAKKGYAFKGWEPNPLGMKVNRPLTFVAQYEEVPIEEVEEIIVIPETVQVNFICDECGTLIGDTVYTINKGEYLSLDMIPSVVANDGYNFDGWDGSTGSPINADTIFTAMFSKRKVHCQFNVGENGIAEGECSFARPYGSVLSEREIPQIKAKKGYNFIGWNISPFDYSFTEDTTFTAQYEKTIPWYKRLWLWLTGKGCLKWVLWILLFFLIVGLLSWLFEGCGCSSNRVGSNNVVPSEQIETPSGAIIDDNGGADGIEGIVGDDGSLPQEDIVVAPIVGEDGQTPPVIQNPGAPDIVANRLNIYFEDANADLEQFVADLSRVYSEEECEVIGMDRHVPMIQIKVAENSRDAIRESLNSKLPNHEFFVVDESIFTIVGNISTDNDALGWHLDAIDVKEGWKITKGKSNIIVAVVDDGIDGNHDILKGRIVSPYNVFTQDNRLSKGDGHGTHVAGLAVGSDRMFDKGISGVAPKCMLMPIQVFDNGVCTFSSVTSGIMYAIHNGANVVNVSIGPNFRGLDVLPIQDQKYIADTQFKNEERVWKRIISVANEHNTIIVFAVGNDNILASIPPENRTNKTVNVAAVDKQIKETNFTNYGAGSNISAPGKGIISSVPTNEYAVFDGTSMAAPIVSGTIALMKSCKPEVSVSEVLHILQATGQRVSEYVPPMIQVDDALIALTTGVVPEMAEGNDNSSYDEQPGESPVGGSNDVPSNNASNPPTNESVGGNDGNSEGGTEKPSRGIDNPNAKPTPEENNGTEKGNENGSGTDYDAIRRLIEQYKQKISELEKLLPENN